MKTSRCLWPSVLKMLVIVFGICTWGVADAYHVEDTQDNYALATYFYEEDSSPGYGWASRTINPGGDYGFYSIYAACFCDPGLIGWYNEDTGTDTSDGWRKKTIHADDPPGECEETVWVTFEVDVSVQITGHFDADNQAVIPLGDCYYYGWAEIILTGLAGGSCETKGTYTAEEGNGNIGVGGAVNVSLPIDFSNDEGELNGDDIASDGDTVLAYGLQFVKARGAMTVHAKSHDGAEEASGWTHTKLQTFLLTIDP